MAVYRGDRIYHQLLRDWAKELRRYECRSTAVSCGSSRSGDSSLFLLALLGRLDLRLLLLLLLQNLFWCPHLWRRFDLLLLLLEVQIPRDDLLGLFPHIVVYVVYQVLPQEAFATAILKNLCKLVVG